MDWWGNGGWVVGVGALLWIGHKVGRETERDEAKERRKKQQQRDIDLGVVAPVAVLWAAGRVDDKEAIAEIKRSSFTNPTAVDLWISMSKNERVDLAVRYAKLLKDPVWQEQQKRDRETLDKMWDEMRQDYLARQTAEPGGAA